MGFRASVNAVRNLASIKDKNFCLSEFSLVKKNFAPHRVMCHISVANCTLSTIFL
jgi:hypothetical protein